MAILVKEKLKRSIVILLTTLVVGALIFMATIRSKGGKIKNVIVHIENQNDNYFVNRADVLQLLSQNGQKEILGANVESLNLKALENRLKNHKFVDRSQVSRDYQGNMHVYLTQRKPIARIIRSNGPGAYIDEAGNILPLSDAYTARVVLISGAYAQKLWNANLNEVSEGKQLLELLRFIHQEPDWHAQIAELEIDKAGSITMYPQITKQKIQFGKPEGFKEKFEKLRILYKQILPAKGWNQYERVDLRHKDQIVCE